MDAKTIENIRRRLIEAGINPSAVEGKEAKMRKLAAIDEAVRAMIESRRAALQALRVNELTVANLERKMKELGGETLSDQAMRNGDHMYEKFLLTYRGDDIKGWDLKKKNEALKAQVDWLKEKNELLHLHDAQYEDAMVEIEKMRRLVEALQRDKADAEKRLHEFEIRNGQRNAHVIRLDVKAGGKAGAPETTGGEDRAS